MRVKYYSASHRLAAVAVADAPPSASLLRPFLDLSGPGDTISARICHRGGQLLVADDGGPLQQGNTRSGLRAAVVAESGLADHAVDLHRRKAEQIGPPQRPPALDIPAIAFAHHKRRAGRLLDLRQPARMVEMRMVDQQVAHVLAS